MIIKGTLIAIGGNENKGNGRIKSEKYTLEYIQEGILSRIVRESGGTDAMIVFIPTASNIPERVSENYLNAFGKLNCSNLHVLDIRCREDAERPESIELIRKADCVMFSGGDQSKIVQCIKDTPLDDIIRRRYHNEDFVIAGTSAGAMCMSQEMIVGGVPKEIFLKNNVKMGKGMGYLPNSIIDSHFIRRYRFGRLAEAVAIFPDLIGIGLSEDTGMVIKQGKNCEVIGSGMMILFDPRELTHSDRALIENNEPMSLANLKIHILAKGDRLVIEKDKIDIFPIRFKNVGDQTD